MTRIAPSILTADFSELARQLEPLHAVELLHLDIMDGHFVPNISFGSPIISSLRRRSNLYFVHT
jgi:ribulose-phosphate 3-epimerase